MLCYPFYSISLGTLTISIAFNEASNAAINDASIFMSLLFIAIILYVYMNRVYTLSAQLETMTKMLVEFHQQVQTGTY